MIRLLLATTNQGKVREMRALLGRLRQLQLVSPHEMGISVEAAEKGNTFEENARFKALAWRGRRGVENVLAEDSGLEVDALGNRPGVFSARFAGEDASDEENIQKLLREMKGVKERSARFVSVVVVILADGALASFRGEVSGTILDHPRGRGGFGYDPVFYYAPRQKSFAELSLAEKNRISHRARALEAARGFLLERFR